MKLSIIYHPSGRAGEYADLACNLYNGCPHACAYCYVPLVTRRDRTGFHKEAVPKKDVIARLTKDAQILKGTNTSVLLCFTTDPYTIQDCHHQLTRQAIKILHENGLSVEMLTKGGVLAIRDFDLLTPLDSFAVTLTFINNKDSHAWEPMASLPQERINSLRLAHERGIKTWVSIEPVIDPEQSLELIRQTYEFTDLYKVGKLNHHKLEDTIDWRQFGHNAVVLLEKLGKDYYIKEDLREWM